MEKDISAFCSHFAVISSVEVLNQTVPLHGNHGRHPGVHRVALKQHVSNQMIVFKVNGNASAHNIKCFRYEHHQSDKAVVVCSLFIQYSYSSRCKNIHSQCVSFSFKKLVFPNMIHIHLTFVVVLRQTENCFIIFMKVFYYYSSYTSLLVL